MANYNFSEDLYSLKCEVANKICKLFGVELSSVELLIEPDYDKLPKDIDDPESPNYIGEDYYETVVNLSEIFKLEYYPNGFELGVDYVKLEGLVGELMTSPYNKFKKYIGRDQILDSITDVLDDMFDEINASYDVNFVKNLTDEIEDLSYVKLK